MNIGIIGCGNIGSAIARHWVEAGHSLILSAKHRASAERLARQLDTPEQVKAASPEQAAAEAEVVLLTIPLGEVPKLSDRFRQAISGKVVLDTCNPYPERDGQAAEEVLHIGLGTGRWTQSQLPGARVVRAFNSVHAETFETQARRSPNEPELVGVPLASDDPAALKVAERLVRDAGFAPVPLGGLAEAKRFDVGTPTYGTDVSATELRIRLGGVSSAA